MRRNGSGFVLASLAVFAGLAVLTLVTPATADTFATSGDKILVYCNFDSGVLCYGSHVAGGPGCVWLGTGRETQRFASA